MDDNLKNSSDVTTDIEVNVCTNEPDLFLVNHLYIVLFIIGEKLQEAHKYAKRK